MARPEISKTLQSPGPVKGRTLPLDCPSRMAGFHAGLGAARRSDLDRVMDCHFGEDSAASSAPSLARTEPGASDGGPAMGLVARAWDMESKGRGSRRGKRRWFTHLALCIRHRPVSRPSHQGKEPAAATHHGGGERNSAPRRKTKYTQPLPYHWIYSGHVNTNTESSVPCWVWKRRTPGEDDELGSPFLILSSFFRYGWCPRRGHPVAGRPW